MHLCSFCRPNKKGKGFPYSIPSVGPGADPGVQAISLQVTVSHPPGGRLPLLSASFFQVRDNDIVKNRYRETTILSISPITSAEVSYENEQVLNILHQYGNSCLEKNLKCNYCKTRKELGTDLLAK